MGGKFFAWVRRLFSGRDQIRDPILEEIKQLTFKQRYHETEAWLCSLQGWPMEARKHAERVRLLSEQIETLRRAG